MSALLQPSGSSAIETAVVDKVSRAVLLFLGVVVLLLLVERLLQAVTIAPLDYNEGWNAYHALRLVETGSPYPPAGDLVVNNYPPLWFKLVAIAGTFTSSLIGAGRLVASLGFALLLISAAGIGRVVRGTWGAIAAFGAVGLVMLTQANDWVAVADPQLLAQGVSACALLLAVRAPNTSSRGYYAAIVLAVLAGFLKHNLAALPAALIFASLIDSRVAFFKSLAISVLALIVGYGLCAAIGGVAWPRQLVSPRIFSLGRVVNTTVPFLTANVMGLVLAALGLRTLPAGHVRRVLAGYLVLALPIAIFFSGGAGVVINIFFDTMIAAALGASFMIGTRNFWESPSKLGERLSAQPVLRSEAPWMFTVALAAWLFGAGLYSLRDVEYRLQHTPIGERVSSYERDIQFLRSVPGNAICDQPALCYMAGKPFIYDPYNAGQLLMTGAMSSEQMLSMLQARNVQVVHAGKPPADTAGIPLPMAAEVRAEFDAMNRSPSGVFLVRRRKVGGS